MNRRVCSLVVLVGTTLASSSIASAVAAEAGISALAGMSPNAAVQFDLPPVAAAVALSDDLNVVTVEIRLSSMIASPESPPIDQWIVRCQPRDRSISIVDYAPRTETGSDVATPIQIKNISEKGSATGISMDGSYGHLARINAAADRSKKLTNSVQFDRVAPVQAVTASGTINFGRGVYFKLRWTAQQILEGEKTFRLSLRVPSEWRGSLMDVSVIAQGERKSFGWDREIKTLGSANFVVALFKDHDTEAETIARSLAESEYALRILAAKHRVTEIDSHSLPSMLRHVANKLDFESDERPQQDWLQRLLTNGADPHLDKQISKLPMPIRIAVLDYVDHRNAFLTMEAQPPVAAIEAIAENQRSVATAP